MKIAQRHLRLMQKNAHRIWQKYGNYDYRTEKQIQNKKVSTKDPGNVWFFWNQFDYVNQKEMYRRIENIRPKTRTQRELMKWMLCQIKVPGYSQSDGGELWEIPKVTIKFLESI